MMVRNGTKQELVEQLWWLAILDPQQLHKAVCGWIPMLVNWQCIKAQDGSTLVKAVRAILVA
jgi:hypothetical protein